MRYVLAGDERDFRDHCRTYNLNPRQRPEVVRRIRDERQLQGITLGPDDDIVITDWWWDNPRGMHHDEKRSMLHRIKILEAVRGTA